MAKGKVLRVLTVCGNGLGSSFACQMAVEGVLKEMGIDCKIDHNSVSVAAGAAKNFDMIVAAENFQKQIDSYDTGLPVVYLHKLVDKTEIKEKLTPVLKEMGYLQ